MFDVFKPMLPSLLGVGLLLHRDVLNVEDELSKEDRRDMAKIIIGVNDLASVYPELASQWYPTKNGNLTPDKITYGSNKIVWWICPSCGHEWEASVKSRSKSPCIVCFKCAKSR